MKELTKAAAAKKDAGRYYVDYDNSVMAYGVFGAESGFCYATFCDPEEAKAHITRSLGGTLT